MTLSLHPMDHASKRALNAPMGSRSQSAAAAARFYTLMRPVSHLMRRERSRTLLLSGF
jgi:hypothetical protein